MEVIKKNMSLKSKISTFKEKTFIPFEKWYFYRKKKYYWDNTSEQIINSELKNINISYLLHKKDLKCNVFSIPVEINTIYSICLRKKYEEELKIFFVNKCNSTFKYAHLESSCNSLFNAHKKKMEEFFQNSFKFSSYFKKLNRLVFWWDMYLSDYKAFVAWEFEKKKKLSNFADDVKSYSFSSRNHSNYRAKVYSIFYNNRMAKFLHQQSNCSKQKTFLEAISLWKIVIFESYLEFISWETSYEKTKLLFYPLIDDHLRLIDEAYFNRFSNEDLALNYKTGFEDFFGLTY